MVADSPHGNSKNNSLSYMRTKSSLHRRIKKEAFSHSPNEVFDLLSGDVRLVESSASVPRNRQQISNARKQLCQNKEKDTLFSVMEKCKRDQSKSVPFIRRVLGAPEAMCLLCYDSQLKDVERFCCNERQFSILGVDATYNLGDFLVTITTYRHLLLEECTTRKSPVMIGPTLIHQTKKTETYYTLASGMVGLSPNLINLIAFGSDGEKAIGMLSQFSFTRLLTCYVFYTSKEIYRENYMILVWQSNMLGNILMTFSVMLLVNTLMKD
jgi:hypothetical protein